MTGNTEDMGAGFGDLLRRYRSAYGLTQEELAEQTRISVRALGDLERDRRQPRRGTVDALIAALHLCGAAADEFRRAGRGRTTVVPVSTGSELPAAVDDFTGRATELATLDTTFGDDAAAVVVVTGKPGSGKTALAVRAAHRLATRFQDAQLYLDLRGADGTPTTPDIALARLLHALGTADPDVPADTDAKAGRFRSLTHRRSILLVFDNAADEHQIRPLLPAGPRCGVLITSRHALLGLDTSRRVTVRELSGAESVSLLGRIAGADRVAGEPVATRTLAQLCGHLPLALRIAGNRLASRPGWTVAGLVDMMADERVRLSHLRVGDLAVRPAFVASYGHLSPAGRTLFARLSVTLGPDFGARSAAALTALDQTDAASLLDELADTHMIEPTGRVGRYRMHDLLRLFGNECLADTTTSDTASPDTVTAVRRRWVTWLVDHAVAAGAWLDPSGEATTSPTPITNRAHALAWLVDEHDTLLAFAAQAQQLDADTDLIAMADALAWYFDLCGRWDDWRQVSTHALAAATRLGDPLLIAATCNSLGLALFCLRRIESAVTLHRSALVASRAAANPIEEATALHFLGVDLAELGQLDAALTLHRSALALAQRLDKPWFRARSLGKIADCLIAAERCAEALAVIERARAIAVELGDVRGEAMCLARLGQAHHGLGESSDAIAHLSESVTLFTRQSDQWSEAWARHSLGLAFQGAGRTTSAIQQYERSTDLFTQSRDRHWQRVVAQARARLLSSIRHRHSSNATTPASW